MMRNGAFRMALAVLALAGSWGAASSPASAHTFFDFGFGIPLGPPIYAPPPVYYAPPPVYYAPPPPVYAPAPQPTYVSPPQQSWYYCDNPQGYYPYVANCASGWRQVSATPPAQ